MKNISFYLILMAFLIVNALSGQSKFQNNRFSNLKAIPVKITTTDDFYMVFDFTETEDKQLEKVFSKEDYAYLKQMTDQENYPDAIKTMELQTANFDKFKKAKAYQIAEFDYGGDPTVILCIPVSENEPLKKEGMIAEDDLILVCQRKDVVKVK